MYQYVDGDPSVADWEAALYGLGADKTWSNFIVSDKLYASYSSAFFNVFSELAQAIDLYRDELRKITSEAIVSGELHDALAEFTGLFDSLSDRLTEVGSSYRTLCSRFIADVEDADEDMYEAGCDPRDYTNERMSYFISLIEDTKSIAGGWLDNLINNFFEGLKELFWGFFSKKNKTGVTIPDSKYTKEYRQALMDKLNYDKQDIKLIQQNEMEIDRAYEQKFGGLYSSLMEIRGIIDRADEIVEGGFPRSAISALIADANNIKIDSYVELENEDITVDNAAQFCSNEENRDVFLNDFNELENARNSLGLWEAVSSAFTSGINSTLLELFRGDIPEEVDASDRYSYLLLKKQLAETVANMAGNPPDISEYEKEQLYNWVYKALSGDTDGIPEQYKGFCDELVKLVRKTSKAADYIMDGLEEAILPLFYDYTANLKIIESLGAGADPDSNLGIAIAQLKQEYTNQFATGFNNIVKYVEDQIVSGAVNSLKKVFKEAIKKCGVNIDLYVMMAEKAAELSGINTVGNAADKIYALHDANEELLKAYQANYDIIAGGNYTEADVENLKNSFTLLKHHYIEEYRAAADLAGAEGNQDLKRHYKERIEYLKNLQMGDLLP